MINSAEAVVFIAPSEYATNIDGGKINKKNSFIHIFNKKNDYLALKSNLMFDKTQNTLCIRPARLHAQKNKDLTNRLVLSAYFKQISFDNRATSIILLPLINFVCINCHYIA